MSDAVWKALSNPHRRALLDALRDGPRATGELAEALPDLSRFAVMQHLGVLVDAGLVLTRKEGRHRHHFLNAVPIQEAYERWVPQLSRGAAATATALRRYLEGEHPVSARDFRLVQFKNSIDIAAPRERVFEAFVHEQHNWYPYTYGGERTQRIVVEPFVGGRVYEDWGAEGVGQLYSLVWNYDPPKIICTRGYLANGVNLENWFGFHDTGKGKTRLEQALSAAGALSEEDADGIRQHGDMTLHADALRAYLGCA